MTTMQEKMVTVVTEEITKRTETVCLAMMLMSSLQLLAYLMALEFY